MLVAFTGKKFNGKDTAGLALADRGFMQAMHATPLKDIVDHILTGFDISESRIENYLYGDKKEEVIPEIGKSARYMLQTLGNEWGRELINEDLWVNFLIASLIPLESYYLTDVRYANEVNAVQNVGGIVIRIVNPRIATNSFSEHASEANIDALEVDYEIINDGTIEELHAKVISTVEAHFNREIPKVKLFSFDIEARSQGSFFDFCADCNPILVGETARG